jgi:ABC-type nitrate/sulfonate/bicarbonate transport system substrate-binding protein
MRLARTGVHVSASRIAPVVLSVAVLVSGCQVLGGSGTGSASGTITVGVVPGVDNAPLSVGVTDGLFRQQGLNVTVQDYPSLSAEFQALASGKIQIAGGDYTSFFYEQATGHTPLRLIADGYDATSDSVAILTLPGSGITTPQQLQAQSGGVATPPAQLAPPSAAVPYNIQTLAAEEVLQNDGVSPSSVNWKPMQAQNMIAALRTGQVSAILASEPYILEAEKQLGAVEVVDASSGVTSGLPMSGYFSVASYARANPPVVQAFQKGLDQAQSECAQRGPVQSALANLSGMKTGDAALVTLGTYPASLNTGQVQRLTALMYDSGMISNQVSVNSMISG